VVHDCRIDADAAGVSPRGPALVACLALLVATSCAQAPTTAPRPAAKAPRARSADLAPTAGSATVLGTPCRAFAADTYWHAAVITLPVEARSTRWLGHMSAGSRRLHPDFGPSDTGTPPDHHRTRVPRRR